MTYTFAKLVVSPSTYDEIRAKLAASGYDHAFGTDDDVELIDMHGIALVRGNETDGKEALTPEEARRILGWQGPGVVADPIASWAKLRRIAGES